MKLYILNPQDNNHNTPINNIPAISENPRKHLQHRTHKRWCIAVVGSCNRNGHQTRYGEVLFSQSVANCAIRLRYERQKLKRAEN